MYRLLPAPGSVGERHVRAGHIHPRVLRPVVVAHELRDRRSVDGIQGRRRQIEQRRGRARQHGPRQRLPNR